MGLEALSDADLMALKSGDLSKVSDAGLMALKQGGTAKRNIAAEIANDPISQGARQAIAEAGNVTNVGGRAVSPELLAANPVTRFASGAAAPFIGAGQLIGNLFSKNPSINQNINQMAEMEKSGAAQYSPEMQAAGTVANIAGNVLSPAALKTAQLLKTPSSVIGRALQGSNVGTGFALATPTTTNGSDYWGQKGEQAGTGAALGAAVPLGIDAAGALARGARHVYRGAIEPFFQAGRNMAEGRAYNAVAGDRAQELAAALRNPTSPVAGYTPTAAEVAATLPVSATKGGQAEFAGLQKNVAPFAPSTQVATEQLQNKALADQIRSFGGDKNTLAQLEAARTAETAPMRETALANANIAGVKGPQLAARLAAENEAKVNALQDMGRFQTFGAQQENLAHGGRSVSGNLSPSAYPVDFMPRIPGRYTENYQRIPEAASAVGDTAEILAKRKAQEGLTQYQLDSLAAHGQFPLEGKQVASKIESVMSQPGQRSSDVVTKALGEIRDKINQFSNKNGVIDSRDLYTIRKEAGNVVKKYAAENKNWDERLTSGLTSNVQRMIDDAIEGAGGSGWKDYLATYAKHSKGINQQQIGQALEGKLTSALQGDAAIRPQAYAAALQESARIPQKAGMPRYQTIEDALTPANMAKVNAVQDVLANRAQAEKLAAAGSKRAGDLTGTPEIVVPPTLSRVGMATRYMARLLQGKGTTKMDEEMARDMLTNAPQVAKLMDQAASRAEKTKIMAQYLRSMTPQAIVGANAITQGAQF